MLVESWSTSIILCLGIDVSKSEQEELYITPTCNCALKSFILALRDSAEALVARLMK